MFANIVPWTRKPRATRFGAQGTPPIVPNIAVQVILRLRDGGIRPVCVTLPGETPLYQQLSAASVAAFVKHPDLDAARIEAVTLQSATPGQMLAAALKDQGENT